MITGDELKAVRKKLGESQRVFGARFGVDQSTVHRWEKFGVPDIDTAISARVTLEYLLATFPVNDDALKVQSAQAE
jgi:transcriptional regulator with XRE-family HTH domain